MEEELISIIIPLYNKEKYIEETIDKIKKQTYKNWEIIIIDDASTDKGRKICEKYVDKKIQLITLEQNSGPAITRNKGIELAKGRYICFNDADDYWKENKLERQIEFMKDKDCAFSYCEFQYINEQGKAKNKKTKIQKVVDYKRALKNLRILTSTVMIDLKKIEKDLIKMPDVLSEDVATWWQILKEGYKAYGLQECLVHYRVTKDSLTSNKFQAARNRWKLYRCFEKLSIIRSTYYFAHYAWNGIIKRMTI